MNRRSFNDVNTSEHNKAARYNRVYSILMVDADGLKIINDEHGHEAGDKLITTFAETIEDCLRDTDSLARYGGDEFVAILPETNKQQAKEVGERIRKAIENTSFDVKGNQIKATVSVGVSSYPDDADNAKDVIIKADKALYKSKYDGRNQVCTTDASVQ